MSQRVPWGRLTPRWSVVRHAVSDEPGPAGLPASRAGLVEPREWVRVSPPLLASAPSSGLTPVRLPVVVPTMVQPVVL